MPRVLREAWKPPIGACGGGGARSEQLRASRSTRLLSRAGVGLLVDGAERSRADVRIDLRRDQALMAQQLLHAANVGPAIEQVRGETMAQRVRRGAQIEVGDFQVF